MPYPSGTFSAASSGLLEVAFSAKFFLSGNADFTLSGSQNFKVRCRVNDGSSDIATIYLDARANWSGSAWLSYPGGNAPWTVVMERGATNVGVGTISVSNCLIACILIKR